MAVDGACGCGCCQASFVDRTVAQLRSIRFVLDACMTGVTIDKCVGLAYAKFHELFRDAVRHLVRGGTAVLRSSPTPLTQRRLCFVSCRSHVSQRTRRRRQATASGRERSGSLLLSSMMRRTSTT
jgi:hypothetical protein